MPSTKQMMQVHLTGLHKDVCTYQLCINKHTQDYSKCLGENGGGKTSGSKWHVVVYINWWVSYWTLLLLVSSPVWGGLRDPWVLAVVSLGVSAWEEPSDENRPEKKLDIETCLILWGQNDRKLAVVGNWTHSHQCSELRVALDSHQPSICKTFNATYWSSKWTIKRAPG